MPSFTLSPSKPGKYSDANGRYARIESGQIPSRGRSLGASRRGKYCLAVAAAAASQASSQSHANSGEADDFQAANIVDNANAASRRGGKKGQTLEDLAAVAGRRSVAMIMDDAAKPPSAIPEVPSGDGSTGGETSSSSASLFVSHIEGIISLLGVIILLILVKFARISSDNATYVRGVLNMLTGLAAGSSAHKLSMTVAVNKIASVRSASSSSSKPPSAAVTLSAMGLKPSQAFDLIFGSDSFFQIVSFIEALCSAVASYMAGSSIITSETVMNSRGVYLLDLDMSQAGTLWGICGLWIFALILHAITAFANKSTIQTVSAASTESIKEIVAVMHTESVYSGKQ